MISRKRLRKTGPFLSVSSHSATVRWDERNTENVWGDVNFDGQQAHKRTVLYAAGLNSNSGKTDIRTLGSPKRLRKEPV